MTPEPMTPLTMTAAREQEIRDGIAMTGGHAPYDHATRSCVKCGAIDLLAELDATRSALREAEAALKDANNRERITAMMNGSAPKGDTPAPVTA